MMKWMVFLYLLTSAVFTEQGEVARGYVGENIIMEFSKSSKLSFLYHHDKKVAIINDCECRLFPGTQFAGRLRCSRNEFDATCTIIIQNVTQRDAGLYKVVREDTVMELWFLNITGTATINTMNPVTLQGSMAETQLHQVSTEAPYRQRTPVKPSISTMNPVTLQRSKTKTEVHQVSTEAPVKLITVHIPDNVIPAVIGVVGVIILMIGFLIWIQRKNTYDHVTVQRLIIEKCETPSFSTPTTIRRTIPMPAWEEGRADRSVPLVKALHDAILGLYCSTTPRNADSVDTLYSSIHSLEKWVDDKPKGDTMFCSNKSSERPNTLVSACDESAEIGILGECPSICTLVSKSGGDDNKTICTVQRKVAKSIQALFEKVNDEPAVSSKYYKNLTASGKADSLCRNEYQMEALSSGFEHEEEFQDVKIASKSTKTRAAACQGTLWSRKEFIHGTEEDNGYETFENIKYTTPVQNDKVSKNVKFLTIKDEEPKEGKRLSDKASKDYADVDL